ncbi:uncharacterized protein LOC135817976 [Sycon ciliatum]|uniref:uncharacterized protein LOC135817976 n=1 Tax=Sycon ciliatum TaxID=27933 RepID=UPI0031F6DE51
MVKCCGGELEPGRLRKSALVALKLLHVFVAFAGVTGVIVEFARPPPFFDSFFEGHDDLPDITDVFRHINPVMHDQTSQIRQLMDVPVLFVGLLYVGAVLYLRFNFEAWLLTGVCFLNYLLYFTVNSWAKSYFEWRYFYYRGVGISLQLAGLTMVATFSVTLVMRKRKRLMFHMKSPFNIKTGGPAHIIWNVIGQSLLYYLCLLMWISRSYQSYVCTQDETNLNFLCQMTEQVACIPCDTCTVNGFHECVSQHNRTTFQTAYCMSGIPYSKGICIFNFSTGYFTFVKLFAYTGGLFFFSRNFLNATMHYVLLLVHSSVQWWRGNATERIESTWSSLSSRFSISERGNLRSYFSSRIRRHSSPGVVTPLPAASAPRYQPQAAHSPILEASGEDYAPDQASERTPLVSSTRSSGRYGASTVTPLNIAPSQRAGYVLPSPQVEVAVPPGGSAEIAPLA